MKKFLKNGLFLILGIILSNSVFAGGWDKSKGNDIIVLKGELICIGCSLKKLSGANAQCSLYTSHDVGLKLGDGTFWNFVNNSNGHDIIRGHKTVIGKQATITGWMYPNAHMIEIETIDVDGVTAEEIAITALEEDKAVAKLLINRKLGEVPTSSSHKH
ncbi:MAG: hypothetical protein QM487_10350 [Candidatus Marithrix sp.]